MAKENIVTPAPEQIAEWKNKYGDISRITVDGKNAYLKKPDRKTLSLATSRIAKNDIVGAGEAILDNCWLGGDPEIKTDDDLFFAAATKAFDLIQIKEAELEKL